MDSGDQLLTILISLGVWSTLSTVALILTRRHVKLGLKLWFMKKLGMEPLLIRYHGANKRVKELIIKTKGLGESIEIRGKKFLVFKEKNGETFFLDESAMRQRDDDVNEISYNFNTIMSADPSESEAMVLKNRELWLVDVKKYQEERRLEGREPVIIENLTKYTDPRRLNKFIDFTYLSAKADALKDANQMEKWVKFGTFAAIGSVLIGVLIWYNIDGKIIPSLDAMRATLQVIANGMQTAFSATVTP